MRLRNTYSYVLATVVLTATVIAVLISCNGTSGPVDPFGDDSKYRFGGVLVKDFNRNVAYAAAHLERNDTLVTDAIITFDGDTLEFSGNRYSFAVGPAESLPAGPLDMVVKDASRFQDTLGFTMPGHLSILSALPPIKGPADRVSVDWTPAANASGYIIAAVKQDSAYMGLGYSQWVTSQSTSVVMNDSAFSIPAVQPGDPNPGTYYIYVYAYHGIPDSTLLSTLLPTRLPDQLDDNIDELTISGTSCSIVTTGFATVEVVAE